MPIVSTASYPPRKRSDPVEQYLLFATVAILILGSISYSIYQIVDSKDQLRELTRAVDQLEPQVRQSQYEKEKLVSLATDVLHLAQTDTNAAKIVAEYKIRELQSGQTKAGTNATPASSPNPAAK